MAEDDLVAPPVHQPLLTSVLDSFVTTVADDFSSREVLTGLVQAAVGVLAVDGAGVMVPDDRSLLRFAFAGGPLTDTVAEAEGVQELLQQGPCKDTHGHGEIIDVADLTVEDAWPEYRRRVAPLGLRGVTTVPLRARGRSWGVLDLYRRQARPCTAAEMAAARTLANLATSYLVIASERWAAGLTRDELVRRALHDQLTDLPVRGVLLEQLTRSIAHLTRRPGHVGVLYLDVDGLKYVNDSYGHAAGDDLLRTVAARVRAALRPEDLLARVGGDEFVVLLDDLVEPGDAVEVAHRVLAALGATHHLPGGHGDLSPSASVGVAITTDPTTTPDALLAHADSAMYRAKRAGRGRVEPFDAPGYEAGRARSLGGDRRQGELRDALDRGELRLHYQPVVEVGAPGGGRAAPGRVRSVEALLRWQHPVLGLLPAGEFLPAAERTALMADVGNWVLGTAARQLVAWDTLLGPGSPEHVLVNVSGLELGDPGLPRRVGQGLARTGLDPARLVLEVTETALPPDQGTALATAVALLGTGCSLAIDDFGTGYSTLRRLVDIPATTLKVDRSFTRDLLTTPAASAVVAAVLRLGRDLDRTVVVEGVEDDATQQALVRLGATHLQGYHLARPAPPDELADLLQRWG